MSLSSHFAKIIKPAEKVMKIRLASPEIVSRGSFKSGMSEIITGQKSLIEVNTQLETQPSTRVKLHRLNFKRFALPQHVESIPEMSSSDESISDYD